MNTAIGAFRTLLLLAVFAQTWAQVVIHEVNAPSTNVVGLCWDGEALWVSDYSSTIYRVDPVSGAVIRSITGPVNGSDGLAFENGYLWTVSRVLTDQTIYKLDTLTGAVVGQIADPAEGYAGGAAWETNGLWVSQYYPQNRLIKVDPVTQQIMANFASPGQEGHGLAFDGQALWLSSQDTNADRVYRVDPTNGQELWSFDLPPHIPAPGRRPRGLAWDGQYLWVTAYQTDSWQVRLIQYDVSNALNPDIDVTETNHDFGATVVGFPVQWSTWVRNIGNEGLVIDSARFNADAPYMLLWMPPFPFTIAGGDSQEFTVDFDPWVPATYPDTLRIYSNDPDESIVPIAIVGVGLPNEGDIDLVPSDIDFGQVRINYGGLSTSRSVEIWNRGSGVLTVNGIQVTGNFFSADSIEWPVMVDSSSFFRLGVWYNPTEVGFHDGVVTFFSDDPDEPILDLPISGVGVETSAPGGDMLWYYIASGGWDPGINSVQWIGDVNGDGTADALVASGNHLVYCLNGSSTGLADTFWTYNTGLDPNHSGIVYYERGLHSCPDLNGDSVEDVIIGTSGGSRSVYALSGRTGEQLWMFDTHVWGEGGWVYEVYPLGDVDGDQICDVVAAAGSDGSGGPERVFAVSGADGTLLWSGPPSAAFFSVRAIADVNNDGLPDVVGGNTDGLVIGLESAHGGTLWQADVGQASGSPVFALLAMGNANPDVNLTEDVAVASAYEGVYVIDGGTGQQIWFVEQPTTFVYELAVGSDINGDEVNEVYVGTVSGHVRCFSGRTGALEWSMIADPNGSENVLSLTAIPDVTGDGAMDIVAGTLGGYVVLVNGVSGAPEWAEPQSPDAVDATGILPDIDGNGSWEILAGSREGTTLALSGGLLVSAKPRPTPIIPQRFALGPVYPNPFNSVVTIPYQVPLRETVTIQVFDLLGRKVQTLFTGDRAPGNYCITWSGTSLGGSVVSSGNYVVVLTASGMQISSRIVLLK